MYFSSTGQYTPGISNKQNAGIHDKEPQRLPIVQGVQSVIFISLVVLEYVPAGHLVGSVDCSGQ